MNAAQYLLADGLDTPSPSSLAIIDDAGRHHTYGDLARAVFAAQATMQDLALGSRVGILAANSPGSVAAYLAAMRQGLVAVPLPEAVTTAELTRNIEWAGLARLYVDEGNLKRHRHLDALTAPLFRLASIDPSPSRLPIVEVPDDADACLLFTSGSTGRPRAVRITHRNIRANTESILAYLQISAADRMFAVLPFTYSFGASVLHTHLRAGATLVLHNNLAFAEQASSRMSELACTSLAGVPSVFHLLLRKSSFGEGALPGLRTIQQAGGRMSPTLLAELRAAQPQARIFLMYGQTEATARLSYLPPDLIDHKPGSIGRGIPGVTLSILDRTRNPVKPGETGEIWAAGESISPGYLNDPEATAERFVDGMLRTGDLGTIDADGFISIVGRTSDFIKTWGYRVSPHEVDAAVLEHPGVETAVTVGIPDEAAGELVAVVAVPRAPEAVTPMDLLLHCRRRLPRHMVPGQVHLVDQLPLGATGKVSLPAVRLLLQGGPS